MKGTTKLRRDDESVLFVVDTAHLRDWSESRLPELLAVCDVTNAAGYWLLVNDVLEAGEIDPDECLKRLWTPGYPVTSKRVFRNPQLCRKLLKQWSGRWDSNPRRPAWEDDYELETKNICVSEPRSGDREFAGKRSTPSSRTGFSGASFVSGVATSLPKNR